MKTDFIVTEEFKLFPWNLKRTGSLNSPDEGCIQRHIAGGLKNPDGTHASIRVLESAASNGQLYTSSNILNNEAIVFMA